MPALGPVANDRLDRAGSFLLQAAQQIGDSAVGRQRDDLRRDQGIFLRRGTQQRAHAGGELPMCIIGDSKLHKHSSVRACVHDGLQALEAYPRALGVTFPSIAFHRGANVRKGRAFELIEAAQPQVALECLRLCRSSC